MIFHSLLRSQRWLMLVSLALAGVAAFHLGSISPTTAGIPQLPQEVLWAWERPEDLRFINPQETGVAFLAGTVFLQGKAVVVRPRLQPLRVPLGTALVAVVRVEPALYDPPVLTVEQREQVASAITGLTDRESIIAVQVDYDAPVSQRAFYGELLRSLRAKLQPGMPLSITALASWCLGDNWLEALPIDEAVPMLFQMGPDNAAVRLHLMQGHDFKAPQCRGSLGLATGEPMSNLPTGRRVYWFHPRAWTAQSASAAFNGAQHE